MESVAAVPEAEQEFKTIAALEEEMRTFESLSEEGGTLLVWGGFNHLYAARMDSIGNILIAAKKIASSDKRITGIGKPVARNGGWLLAIRETDRQNVDQIRLIQLDASGKAAEDLVWLKNFERISLPVFLDNGDSLKAAYFAGTSRDGGLFLATLTDLQKMGEPRRLKTFEGKQAYPPLLLGAVYENAYALLLYHRSSNPPPMRFLLVNPVGGILKDAEVAQGKALQLSDPVFQVSGNTVRVAWLETINKTIPPRLVALHFTKAGEVSRKAIPFASPLDIPRQLLMFDADGLSGVAGVTKAGAKPAFVRVALPDASPSVAVKSLMSPNLPEGVSLTFSDLLLIGPERNTGLLLWGNRLIHFDYSETGQKEKEISAGQKDYFDEFQKCVEAKTARKECSQRMGRDWNEKKRY